MADSGHNSRCEAHVAVPGNGEIVVPCGVSGEVSSEGSIGWIETPAAITPFVIDVSEGGQHLIRESVPAGTISFPPDRMLAPGERIRLVSAVPRTRVGNQWLFARDVASRDATARVPAGPVIALLLDARGNAIGASDPVPVRAGTTTAVWPARPTGGATLVAWLRHPPGMPVEAGDPTSVEVVDSTGKRPPDVQVDAGDALFAVWYGLDGPNARLLLDSKSIRLNEETVAIARGTVTMTRQHLAPLPTLQVTLGALPDAAPRPGRMSLRVARADDELKPIRELAVEPGGTYDLARMPAAPLVLDLTIDEFVLQQRVDLTSGSDSSITIPLNPLVVSGTVHAGDTPARASLRFGQKGSPVIVETNEHGSYEVTLWQPRRYIVETLLSDRPSIPPFSQEVQIAASDTLDIHVPANVIRVRVFDAADRKPVLGAEVMIQNQWAGELGSLSSVISVAVNGEVTELPPQRAGTSDINVRAAGYAPAGPFRLQIDESLREKTIEIPMTRSADRAELLILLNGSPAPGAEIAAFSADRLIWHGTADASGRIAIPESVTRARAIVRHPAAASDVIVFGPLSGRQQLSLAPSAPPLLVRAVDRQGRPAGPAAARVTLWLTGGVRLTGAEAAFATWSLAATGPDGTFVAKGVGARPIRILLTRRTAAGEIAGGAFDAVATTISYPWPPIAEVVIADE